MSKKLTEEEKEGIYAEPDDGLVAAHFPDSAHGEYLEVRKGMTYARIPRELIPFVEVEDIIWSHLKQLENAEKRRSAKEGPRVDEPIGAVNVRFLRPNIITSALDLLILREKRREWKAQGILDHEEGCPNFTVCGRTAGLDSPKYELVLEYALSFIDSCLYLEDAEGKPWPKYTVSKNLIAIGVPLPDEYAEFRYLENHPVPPQSYWADAANYAHLTKLRHRAMDEA